MKQVTKRRAFVVIINVIFNQNLFSLLAPSCSSGSFFRSVRSNDVLALLSRILVMISQNRRLSLHRSQILVRIFENLWLDGTVSHLVNTDNEKNIFSLLICLISSERLEREMLKTEVRDGQRRLMSDKFSAAMKEYRETKILFNFIKTKF